VLNSLFFAGAVILAIAGLHVIGWRVLGSTTSSVQVAILLIAARLMWSALQWMGRY
jgi:hypothetical protein